MIILALDGTSVALTPVCSTTPANPHREEEDMEEDMEDDMEEEEEDMEEDMGDKAFRYKMDTWFLEDIG